MRILLKIILVPVVIALWLVLIAAQMAESVASWILNLLSGVCIVIGLACLLFREATFQEVVPPFVTAFCVTVVSATAELLVEGIGGLCGKIGGFIID